MPLHSLGRARTNRRFFLQLWNARRIGNRRRAMAEKYHRSSGAKEVSGMTDAERPEVHVRARFVSGR